MCAQILFKYFILFACRSLLCRWQKKRCFAWQVHHIAHNWLIKTLKHELYTYTQYLSWSHMIMTLTSLGNLDFSVCVRLFCVFYGSGHLFCCGFLDCFACLFVLFVLFAFVALFLFSNPIFPFPFLLQVSCRAMMPCVRVRACFCVCGCTCCQYIIITCKNNM